MATIPGLLLGCSPTQVTRRIATIVVDSVERHSLRTRPEVGEYPILIAQEATAPKPIGIDGNPSAAVALIGDVLGIRAAGNHAVPRPEKGMFYPVFSGQSVLASFVPLVIVTAVGGSIKHQSNLVTLIASAGRFAPCA